MRSSRLSHPLTRPLTRSLRRSLATTASASASAALPDSLVVAAAQLRPDRTLDATVREMERMLADAAGAGAQVLVLPEAATVGYSDDAGAKATAAALADAEDTLRAACRRHSIAAVIGTPHTSPDDGRCFNSAVLIDERGELIGRQHKMQLVPTDAGWSVPGERQHVFRVCGVPCAVIICHDKRYPELARLPVLAGARVLFYISAEAWHDDLPLPAPREPPWDAARLAREVGVYTAQTQARAVENRVWLVKSNVAGSRERPLEGSHGMSCVVDPTGVVVAECGMFDEEMVVHALQLADAHALYAQKSLLPEYAMARWWEEGVRSVVVHD